MFVLLLFVGLEKKILFPIFFFSYFSFSFISYIYIFYELGWSLVSLHLLLFFYGLKLRLFILYNFIGFNRFYISFLPWVKELSHIWQSWWKISLDCRRSCLLLCARVLSYWVLDPDTGLGTSRRVPLYVFLRVTCLVFYWINKELSFCLFISYVI